VIQTDRGGILITGCAHPGILHVLERAREMTQDKMLIAMGGFHLGSEGVEKLQQVVQAFR